MPINIILELVPQAVELLESKGLHCVSCHFNSLDTLENGMKIHGKTGAELNKLVFELNNLYKLHHSDARRQPQEADMISQTITEGNKTYIKIAGMLFEKKTVDNLEIMAGDKSGLQIRIEAGGCSGYKNTYDFAEEPAEDEKAFPLTDSLSLFMNHFTFDHLYESVVTYESGLHGSGLQFHNPNVKKACSCGKSFGF